MGLKTSEVQALVAAAEAGGIAAAIARDGGLRRARFHVTHLGGGGAFELSSTTPDQYFEHPIL